MNIPTEAACQFCPRSLARWDGDHIPSHASWEGMRVSTLGARGSVRILWAGPRTEPQGGTLYIEPLCSQPCKKEDPDLFIAGSPPVGASEGSVRREERAVCLSNCWLGRMMLNAGLHWGSQEGAGIVQPLLWSINPFITNHLVNDESV